jgi:Tc toxin complex TcA C-terminal TcB-binding domain/Putative peptidoglycan binding domain
MAGDYPVLGSRGTDVARLHRLLERAGMPVVSTEGGRRRFGETTAAVIRRFQEEHGLEPTGRLDPRTAEALGWDGDDRDEGQPRFVGRVVGAGTGDVLAGLRIRASAVVDDLTIRVGDVRTDDEGRFELSLNRIEETGSRSIRLRIADRSGRLLAEEDAPLAVDEVVEISVRSEVADPAITDAARAAGVTIRRPLAAWLRERRLETLGDVRRSGGLARRPNLPAEPDDPAVRTIDALAALATLPGDLATRIEVARAGYASVVDIARAPEATFVDALGDVVGAEVARDVHAAAEIQTGYLTQVLTHVRLGGGGPVSWQERIDAAVGRACGCPDCRNALSPIAYLADLLDYAVRHLRESGAPLTITRLAQRFCQPFASLPADCRALDERVRRVRIAVEVLRAYLAYTATPDWYPARVYDTLLERLGTSTAELRDARHAPDEVRAALAARLGVPVLPGRPPARPPDPLDILFEPVAQGNLTEAIVESLFGYRDTHRSPTDPDPLPSAALFGWRMTRLLDTWTAQDWSANPPADMRPLIDPDQLDAADFADTASPAYALYTRRLTWVGTRLAVKRSEREQFGLDAMLQDLPVSGLAQIVTVADLIQLEAQQAAGTSIQATLDALDLRQADFERLAAIAQLDQAGATVLDEEWEDLYSILVAIEKRRMFAVWRAEERTPPAGLGPIPAGYFPLTLTARYFRLRPAPMTGGVDWRPKPWRSDVAARADWVATLRSRIDQERGVGESLRAVIDDTEEACLWGLRDVLVATVPSSPLATRADWVTRHLQIDVAAGSCDVTTRVAQAIATIQGILFGARSGLLEDETIALDAPHFDEEWQWIGSYPTWRSAMLLFLYPEAALQPALRRRRSPGFARLVGDLQAIDGTVDAAAARRGADRYAAYFDDICSLDAATVRVARRRTDTSAPAFFAADVVALARAQSGRLYMSGLSGRLREQLVGPPFLVSVEDQSFWEEIDPLPAGTDVAGLAPYRMLPGGPRLAVYGRQVVDGTARLLMTTFDGTGWSRPAAALTELPGLVRVVELQGLVPADPLAEAEVEPWAVRGDDWVVAADIDGDGRREIVVFANAAQGGQRAVGVIRERDAMLVTSARATIPAALTPFVPGGPVVLRVTRSSWPWRPERILLGDPGVPGLALLGATAQLPLTVLNLPGGPFGGLTLSFGDVVFAAADLDADGDSELVIVDYVPVTSTDEYGNSQAATATRVSVFNVTDTSLALRDQELLPGLVTVFTRPGIADRWEGFRALTLENGAQGFIVRTVHQYFSGGGNPTTQDEWVGILRFNPGTNMFARIELYPRQIGELAGGAHLWTHSERLEPVQLGAAGGAGPGSEILVTDPATTDTRILGRQPSQAGNPYSSVWQDPAQVSQPAGSAATPWARQSDDRFLAADLDGDGLQEIVAFSSAGRAGLMTWNAAAGTLELGWSTTGHVAPPGGGAGTGWRLRATDRYVVADVDGDGCDELITLAADGRLGLLRGLARPSPALLSGTAKMRPQGVVLRTVEEKRSRSQLVARQAQMLTAYQANLATPHNLTYLDEAYYFVPVELGLRLARDGAYTASLDWLASVYDYVRPAGTRKVAGNLLLEERQATQLARAPEWLRDPLNPHAIAAVRQNAYTRYTILTIVRVLLAYADSEFTRETSESVPRARALYLEALELLTAPELTQRLPGCSDLIDRITIEIGEPVFVPLWREVRSLLADVTSLSTLESAVRKIERIQKSGRNAGAKLAAARSAVLEALAEPSPAVETAVDGNTATLRAAVAAALTDDHLAAAVRDLRGFDTAGSARPAPPGDAPGPDRIPIADMHGIGGLGGLFGGDVGERLAGYFVHPSFSFCVAPNPDLEALRTHAEVNLRKIRTCRNIAGAATRLEPYAQPTVRVGIAVGRLSSPGSGAMPALPYRYPVLVERARQLVMLATQIEASLLGTLERRDAAAYDELRSRQDLALAGAGVRLKELQLAQAAEGAALADLGRERAQLQLERAKVLYDEAVLSSQIDTTMAIVTVVVALAAAVVATEGAAAAAAPDIGATLAAQGRAVAGAGSGLVSAISSGQAALDNLEFQIALGSVDVRVADAQASAALDGVLIATQDRAISAMRLEHAEAVAEFIARRFTGLPLYEWMSGVLQDVYRFFLQQAASMARLAEAQLAFERQEIPPPFIQGDYWAKPASLAATGGSRGLTGSARLLRDIYEMDQYAFRTDQRKLQLSKTISLARLDPLGFQRFRETGVMRFATPTRLFDQDFPGHYLRLIKRVRVSVVALIPPTEGIHATLSTTGPSRVVQGAGFETVVVARGAESVALTSPRGSSGLFDLDSQPEMLVPFEHMGVDATWEFSMPKAANQFDYASIADVLLSIDYTALDSPLLREQVLAGLDRHVSFQRMFSFRNELIDQWFDLHNPNQAPTPNRVRFRTDRRDFLPNLEDIRIDHVTLYFSPTSGSSRAGWQATLRTRLSFVPDEGTTFQATTDAQPVNGVITTLPGVGNTPLWTPLVSTPPLAPFGEWELEFSAAAQPVFASGTLDDMLFVIGYAGTLPRWP